MKLTTKMTAVSFATIMMMSQASAAEIPVNDNADITLTSLNIPYQPVRGFIKYSSIATDESEAVKTINLIEAEKKKNADLANNKKAEVETARDRLRGLIEQEDDPVARAIIQNQIRNLDNAESVLTKAASELNALHASGLGRGTKVGLRMNGQWIAASRAGITPQLSEMQGSVEKMVNDVTSAINATTDESIQAQVSDAKKTLATGTAATGGIMTAPGVAAGDEKIIVTEGVTNRTIPGQHGDLLMHGIGSGEAILRETTALGETKRNASLLMLGEHQEAKISAGESAILIGDNSKTEGNGIAIGKNATSGNDSIALGNNSVATGANELSIGNDDGLTRKITHMADGTNDSDGATIHNVKSEISSLDSKAHEYANTAKKDAITEANKYTDTAKTAAIDVANKYTDSEITTLNTKAQGYATAAKSEAVKDANQYSDDTAKETLKSANDYTERRAVVAENNAVTRSNAYTDESSSRTLESANTYTNHRSVQAENNAVARSNAYTDNRFGELKHQVDRNEKRANGGIAGAMAMTAIPSVPGHDFSFGMATSGYRGQGAIAAGVKANITQNTTVSLNTAWDSGNGVGVAAGFSVGW
ncbi:hypothetical protein AHN45_24180 [Salmonella enterica subsp. enterica]|nr:hypothetical protein [Salmonella enterica subsp. enterica]